MNMDLQKSRLMALIRLGGPMHSPLASFLQRRRGWIAARHPSRIGPFLWCPFELLADILFRVRPRIPFAKDPT
jgi:hypothetical protein